MSLDRSTHAPRRASEARHGLARASGVGALLVPLFCPLDVYLRAGLYPTANLLEVFGLRAIATASAALAWYVGREARFSDRAAFGAHVLCVFTVGLCLALMGVQFGGPNSPYFQGITLIIMIRSGAVPERFPVAVSYALMVVLTWCLVVWGYALTGAPETQLWWTSREALLFGANLVLVSLSCSGGAIVSHITFRAKEQVYKARRLGRFRLEAPIGRGGQNEVWLAWDTHSRRQVALKLLRRNDATPEAIRLFEREAAAAGSLRDPHNVRIYDFGASDDGILYLAMEFVPGSDLAALVRGHGPIPAARAIFVGEQVCTALAEAHQTGLLHRDVKPANIMVIRRDGDWDSVRVLDFGIAGKLATSAQDPTNTGVLRGTPAFLAPECVRGERASVASDVYGLGATLYYVLTGQAPFAGSEVQVLAKKLVEQPLRPSALRSSIPPDLEALVMRCLADDPAERYGSMEALRRALLDCADAGRWTPTDAELFWNEEQAVLSRRWEAPTLA